jgi:hypothetical protein
MMPGVNGNGDDANDKDQSLQRQKQCNDDNM